MRSRRVSGKGSRMRKAIGVTVFLSILILVVGIAAAQTEQTNEYEVSIEPHRLSTRTDFWIYTEGTIELTLQWTGPRNLRLLLYGPGQEDAYLDVIETSPMTKSFAVTSEMLARGQGRWKWQFQVGNASSVVAQLNISVTYPKSLPVINYSRAEARHGDALPFLGQEAGILEYAAFPTQEFTLNWSVDLAMSGITLEWSCGAVSPELASGVTRDCPNPSTALTSGRGSRQETLGELGQVYTLIAKNKHGSSEARVIVVPQVWIGYNMAVCVGCSPCQDCGRTPEIERLAAILREIEGKLNDGCIRSNSELDRFGDPYLRDGLTADILNAMYYLVVYPDDDFLPDLGARTKCDVGVYGYTPGNKEYVMICLRKGADGLTLLHELEHYVDPNTTECRAPWVAQWCYGCPATIPCPTCSD